MGKRPAFGLAARPRQKPTRSAAGSVPDVVLVRTPLGSSLGSGRPGCFASESLSLACSHCGKGVEANRISKAVEAKRWDEPPGFGQFGVIVGATLAVSSAYRARLEASMDSRALERSVAEGAAMTTE